MSHRRPWDSSQGACFTLPASPSPLGDFHSSPGAETRGFVWKAPPALLGIPEIQDLCSRPELHGGGSWTNIQSRWLCKPQAIPFLSHQGPDGLCPISHTTVHTGSSSPHSPHHTTPHCTARYRTAPHQPTPYHTAPHHTAGSAGQWVWAVACRSLVNHFPGEQAPASPAPAARPPCSALPGPGAAYDHLPGLHLPQLQGLVQVPVATFMWAPGY